MRFPNDRKFVDGDGKVMDHWARPLSKIEPFLSYTDLDFRKLRVLLDAQPDPDE